jgi:hypothetical protein
MNVNHATATTTLALTKKRNGRCCLENRFDLCSQSTIWYCATTGWGRGEGNAMTAVVEERARAASR